MKHFTAFLFALLLALPVPAYSAGTLFGLPLSIQTNAEGEPEPGAKLFIYDANSSNPADAFRDYGLTEGQELPHPIEADSAGRLPQFWLDDGAYRARLTTAAGVEIFDIASIQALGPSGGTGSGSGSVDQQAVFSTGDFLWQPVSGTRSGWVRANGRTIGSAASGATERANADTGPLYEWLWNNFSDALAPVSGGRGANAAADFAANKTIGVLDMRGRTMLGLDTMGNSAAGVVATATSAGLAIGAESTSITILQANLPSVTLSVTNGTNVVRGGNLNTLKQGPDSSFTTVTSPSQANLTVPLGGSDTAISKSLLNPSRAGTVFIKL